jgi:hypothetical protein
VHGVSPIPWYFVCLDKHLFPWYNRKKRKEAVMNEEITQGIQTPTDPETERLIALLSESSAVPLSCDDGELASTDFSKLDVLIGTVRSDEQFDYCMTSHTYYIPAKTVTPEELPVRVVALYEEGLSRRAGIKRYGVVTDTRVVKRGDIPVTMSRGNPDETYYLFSVESWNYLETPIAILGTVRGKPAFTNTFLLEHCRRSYQLTAIRSPEAYRLCCLLCRLAEDAAAEPVILRRVGERHLITVDGGQIRLLDTGGTCLYACEVSLLTHAPAEVLRGMSEGLGLS